MASASANGSFSPSQGTNLYPKLAISTSCGRGTYSVTYTLDIVSKAISWSAISNNISIRLYINGSHVATHTASTPEMRSAGTHRVVSSTFSGSTSSGSKTFKVEYSASISGKTYSGKSITGFSGSASATDTVAVTYTAVGTPTCSVRDNGDNTYTISGKNGTSGTNNATSQVKVYYKIGSGSWQSKTLNAGSGAAYSTSGTISSTQTVYAYAECISGPGYGNKSCSQTSATITYHAPLERPSYVSNLSLTCSHGDYWVPSSTFTCSWSPAVANSSYYPVQGYRVLFWVNGSIKSFSGYLNGTYYSATSCDVKSSSFTSFTFTAANIGSYVLKPGDELKVEVHAFTYTEAGALYFDNDSYGVFSNNNYCITPNPAPIESWEVERDYGYQWMISACSDATPVNSTFPISGYRICAIRNYKDKNNYYVDFQSNPLYENINYHDLFYSSRYNIVQFGVQAYCEDSEGNRYYSKPVYSKGFLKPENTLYVKNDETGVFSKGKLFYKPDKYEIYPLLPNFYFIDDATGTIDLRFYVSAQQNISPDDVIEVTITDGTSTETLTSIPICEFGDAYGIGEELIWYTDYVRINQMSASDLSVTYHVYDPLMQVNRTEPKTLNIAIGPTKVEDNDTDTLEVTTIEDAFYLNNPVSVAYHVDPCVYLFIYYPTADGDTRISPSYVGHLKTTLHFYKDGIQVAEQVLREAYYGSSTPDSITDYTWDSRFYQDTFVLGDPNILDDTNYIAAMQNADAFKVTLQADYVSGHSFIVEETITHDSGLIPICRDLSAKEANSHGWQNLNQIWTKALDPDDGTVVMTKDGVVCYAALQDMNGDNIVDKYGNQIYVEKELYPYDSSMAYLTSSDGELLESSDDKLLAAKDETLIEEE